MATLYVLDNGKGFIKIGIAKENVNARLNIINKKLSEENKFRIIETFEVNEHLAKVEKFIHEFLNHANLNLQNIQNKFNIVELEILLSANGYTEFFLADSEKIKQGITFFGLLGLINISEEKINNLDQISSYTLHDLYQQNPYIIDFIKNDNEFKYNQRNVKVDNISVINNSLFKEKCEIEFFIENGFYYASINGLNICVQDFFKKEKNELRTLINLKENLEPKNIESLILNKLLNQMKIFNGDLSIQSSVSLNIENKKDAFYEFMIRVGAENIYNLIKPFCIGGGGSNGDAGAYELIDKPSCLLARIDDELTVENRKVNIKMLNSLKRQLLNPKMLEPNFDSPKKIFTKYLNLVEKCYFLNKDEYTTILNSAKMLGAIFTILYYAEDKEIEFKKIDNFIEYIDDFYKYTYDKGHILRHKDGVKSLEKLIISLTQNKIGYYELAEATIKTFNESEKYEEKTLNKIKINKNGI